MQRKQNNSIFWTRRSARTWRRYGTMQGSNTGVNWMETMWTNGSSRQDSNRSTPRRLSFKCTFRPKMQMKAEKDKFYDQLQNTIDDIPNHDIKLLIGDMNVQISDNRQGIEHVIGSHATARRTNDNGERLVLFCSINNFCIGNTYFAHKNIHKKTWRSSDENTNNEIDYICISKRWRSAIQDVRVYRGANVRSDHYLMKASLRLRLKRKQEQPTVRPWHYQAIPNSDPKQIRTTTIYNRMSKNNGRNSNKQWPKVQKQRSVEEEKRRKSDGYGTAHGNWLTNGRRQKFSETRQKHQANNRKLHPSTNRWIVK